jgi:hypothetical protein
VLLADDVTELTFCYTKATLSFSDARLIGREHNYTTVYRVVLPGGMAAAAKSLDRADALQLLGRHRRCVHEAAVAKSSERESETREACIRSASHGPNDAGIGWVGKSRLGKKTLQFWQKHSPNCDFYDCSTFFVIMQSDGESA